MNLFDSNRITQAITKMETKLKTLPAAKLKAMTAATNLTFNEHFEYQNAQSQAFAGGKLAVDEAQVLYCALGEYGTEKNGGWAEGTTLATKIVVTVVIQELLAAKIASMQVQQAMSR